MTSVITTGITDVSMSGYLAAPVEPPCFEIDFPDDGFLVNRTAGGKTTEFTCILRGIVKLGEPMESQARLDGWLSDGAENVEALLKANRTLGGALAGDLFVRSISSPRRLVIDNSIFLCAEWTIDVIVSNS